MTITSIATLNIPGMMIFRRNEVDPLVCLKCQGDMRIRGFVKAIPQYLGLWLIQSRPPTKAHAPPVHEYAVHDASQTDFPVIAAYGDPDYS